MTTETNTELTTTLFADASAAILSRLQAVEAAEEMWQQAAYLRVAKIPCRECGGAGTVANGSLGDICPGCMGARAEDVALELPPALRSARAQLLEAHRQIFEWHLDPKGEMPAPEMPPWSAIQELLESAAAAHPEPGAGWRKFLPAPAATTARFVEDPSLDEIPLPEPNMLPGMQTTGLWFLHGEEAQAVVVAMGGIPLPEPNMLPGMQTTGLWFLHGEEAQAVVVAMGGSVLPLVFDDGSAIVCSSIAGGARSHAGIPNDLHLTIRQPGREDQFVRYSRQINYTDDYLMRLEQLHQSYGNQDTPDDWRALQRDVGEMLRAAGFELEATTSKWRVAELLPSCSPHRQVRWTIDGTVKQAYVDAHRRFVVGVLDANEKFVRFMELTVDDLTEFGEYVDVEAAIEVEP